MYDLLLTLHLFGAAAAFITIAFFSVWALGMAAPALSSCWRTQPGT